MQHSNCYLNVKNILFQVWIRGLFNGQIEPCLQIALFILLHLGFLGLKNLLPGQFWGAPTRADIIEFYDFLLQLKNNSKSPCILLNKNIDPNKKVNGIENGKSHTQF